MLASASSGREPSLVDDDFLPDADRRVRETALESHGRMVLPAILRVVADADLDGARDEVVLEASVARRRVQANLEPPQSVFRPRRSVVLAPNGFLVRPGAPGGLAVLELERDVVDLKSQIGNGPIKSNGAFGRRLARGHKQLTRRRVRAELAVPHLLGHPRG